MSGYFLRVRLISDTTFGRGDGVSGSIDAEVEHDAIGLPFLRGRTLKGLLAEECANIIYAIECQGSGFSDWRALARRLFGQPGSTLDDDGELRISDARLPGIVIQSVKAEIDLRLSPRPDEQKNAMREDEVIAALTAIRRQTAIDPNGAPRAGSLRSARVVLRQTIFEAPLSCDFDLNEQSRERELGLLVACAASLRRAGSGRNRGRGRVQVTLLRRAAAGVEDLTTQGLNIFGKLLKEVN